VNSLLTAAGAGLAVLVELIEAFAIVLAVGTTRTWRDAWLGAAAAGLACALVAAVLGPVLLQHLGLRTLRLVIGAALLWFGLNWLRKNTLRLAGRKRRSSSQKEFDETQAALRASPQTDWVAFAVSFKGVFLEGLEIVLIVSVLAQRPAGPAPVIIGSVAAAALVIAAAAWLRKPLTRLPETELKFTVGVLLTTFGAFFTGEGLGIDWPAGDATLLVLLALVLGAAMVAVRILRPAPERV
jgi:uncharacterized membrane protein